MEYNDVLARISQDLSQETSVQAPKPPQETNDDILNMIGLQIQREGGYINVN